MNDRLLLLDIAHPHWKPLVNPAFRLTKFNEDRRDGGAWAFIQYDGNSERSVASVKISDAELDGLSREALLKLAKQRIKDANEDLERFTGLTT